MASLRGVDAAELIVGARTSGRHALTEVEGKALLAALGVAVPCGGVARSEDDAVVLARRLNAPGALKVVAPDVIHKSDIGGVVCPVAPGAVQEAYHQLVERVRASQPGAPIEGVLVEEFLEGGVECVVGFVRTAAFGPVVMFGLGGIFVEVLEDVSFRLVPLGRADALELMDEIRGARCLDGVRGRPAVSREALARVILAVASVALDPALQRIRAIDINPLLAGPDRAVALDCAVTLEHGATDA
jgi:succinyl-CoA synthetase beta subunit